MKEDPITALNHFAGRIAKHPHHTPPPEAGDMYQMNQNPYNASAFGTCS
jgi:hypothetical protein